MTTKKPKLRNTPKQVEIKPSRSSPMEKFHKTMKKIVFVTKKDLKDK